MYTQTNAFEPRSWASLMHMYISVDVSLNSESDRRMTEKRKEHKIRTTPTQAELLKVFRLDSWSNWQYWMTASNYVLSWTAWAFQQDTPFTSTSFVREKRRVERPSVCFCCDQSMRSKSEDTSDELLSVSPFQRSTSPGFTAGLPWILSLKCHLISYPPNHNPSC